MKVNKPVCWIIIMLTLGIVSISANEFTNINFGNRDINTYKEQQIAYAVIIKEATYNDSTWHAVVDTLLARYQGQVFIWNSSLDDVKDDVVAFQPTHIGFVCNITTAAPSFIMSSIWSFTRDLDDDIYCDAIWGIITGCDAQDAINLVTGPTGFEIKTVLGGTTCCDLNYYTQGISTSEASYGEYYIKHPDSLETSHYTGGPTDRTVWLVTMINDGIDIFNYDPVDIFYTSGHGSATSWQLHFPSSGNEGYFRSSNGQVYGDPHIEPDTNINSDHPKIYFGLGNCNIGQIYSSNCMAPSWIHTGGAYQYTGYLIGEGSNSFQHGGTKAYFYRMSRDNTWAEAFFLSNQALKFDITNNTPGVNPTDLNGSALYGDPGMQVKMSNEGVFQQPLFTSELIVNEGTEKDTITFKIAMNREGNPGTTSKWGNRHPAIILPFRAENIEIIYTDAITAIVEDNFALMYIWYQGQSSLAEGETREVVFTCDHTITGIDEETVKQGDLEVILYQNQPNPFREKTVISYQLSVIGNPLITDDRSPITLSIYDLAGRLICTFPLHPSLTTYRSSIVWDAKDISPGIYFYRITGGDFSAIKKCIILK